jgi:trimeric autotransporter adhesin
MKRTLLTMCILAITGFVYSQTTYYWVGGTTPSTSITIAANWNTVLDGSGSTRPSATGATDILVFDGSNVGGAVPATGAVTCLANGSITCAQMKFVNNAAVSIIRASSGTSTLTLNGDAGEDFVVEAGCTVSFTSTVGSIRMALAAACTGRVSGSIVMVTGLQARFDNTLAGTPNSFIFTSGASLTTNITSASSSYAFGNSSQSSPNWVTFQAGSHIYYDGGFSPNGSGNLFSAIDMRPGSTWHHRATNPIVNAGNFFNQKSYGNIIVENNASLIALGTIYRIENLTINTGSTFTTHTSGQTVVLGNIVVNGALTSDAASTNELVLGGSTAQTIFGSGTVSIASLLVADNANVSLTKDISVDKTITVNGRLNFSTYKITGNATFTANGPSSPLSTTGNLVAGSYIIPAATTVAARGLIITGTGITANTSVVALSPNNDSIYLSNPATASGSGVALSMQRNGATLQNNNTNGYNPVTGSVISAGIKTYNDLVNYIIDGATTWPFGVTTGSPTTPITAKYIEINAPVTVNRAFTVSDHLTVNGKITLRPLDIVHILPGAIINGTVSPSNYIATATNSSTGEVSILQYDGPASSVTLPVGTSNFYLPVTLSPASSSNFTITVFEGITYNGAVNGTPFTPSEKQNVVNAVWNINRLSGSGNSDIQLGWNAALEGSTFATLPNTDIGIIRNTGSSWSLPLGPGNNTANTAAANVSSFGSFAVGAVPQVQPFVFNTLPPKTYGAPDFNGGATSLNTTQPIVYSSDNLSVATIVAGNIHITGAGTANITASQASDGFYPAGSISQSLTVAKANLTITADNKTKFEQQPNPTLTITYTGFVYSETSAALLTQPTITTTATTASAPGTYPITLTGATSNNYNITFVNGTLTVQPKQNQSITFAAPATKTYGNADFATGATSTNSTIPITYTTSNPAVATITGNTIHITGAGTTTITASQAGNAGYFPAADVARTLTVNKAALTIRVLDTVKVEGQPNPAFTITYTGFVLGETVTNLTTPPTITTIATATSPAGYYTLTPGGAVTNNYTITYTTGRLTIYPLTGTGQNHIHAFMPNGATLTVRVYSTLPSLADIKIYDLNGKPLVSKNVFLPQGFQNADINVAMIPAGIYVITVRGSGVDLKKTIPIIKY